MMNAWRWNGKTYEPSTTVPVTDRGFRYGMALFETVRLHHGRALFLEQHLERIRAACLDRAFPLPETALTSLAPLLAKQPDGTARLYITAGDGILFTDQVHDPRIIVLCETRSEPAAGLCSLAVFGETYHPPFGGLKTANYWSNIDALQRALRSEHDEALLFNENSELVSAATANVFIVRGVQVSTPAVACGVREGVTRAWVMNEMRVCECSLFLEDLQKADEIFLTNSWYGIRPAASLDGRPLPSHTVGDRLARAYEQAIGA